MNDFSSSDFNNNSNNNVATNDQSLSVQNAPFADASSGPNGLPNIDTTAFPNQSSPISAPQSAAPTQTPASPQVSCLHSQAQAIPQAESVER